jgi:hypothetical protein
MNKSADNTQVVVEKRGRGRPKGSGFILTEEQRKEKKRFNNAKRGPREIIHRHCEACDKEYNSNNFSRHLKGLKHINNMNRLNGNLELEK